MMTTEQRVQRMLRNGILTDREIAISCLTSMGFVKVIKSRMKKPEFYEGYNTRKMRDYRAEK